MAIKTLSDRDFDGAVRRFRSGSYYDLADRGEVVLTGDAYIPVQSADGSITWTPDTTLKTYTPVVDLSQYRGDYYSPRKKVEFTEQFFGGGTTTVAATGFIGDMGWIIAASGTGAGASKPSLSQFFGQCNAVTGTTATGFCCLSLAQSEMPGLFGTGLATSPWELEWHMGLNQINSAGVQEGNIYMGVGDIFTGATFTNGAWFQLTNASPNYQAVLNNAGTATLTDTGVVASATGTVRPMMRITFDGVSVRYYIDDVLKATNTTPLPSGGAWHAVAFVNTKTVGTTSRDLRLDYVHFHMIRATPI